jgi:hypothetical protein
MKNWLDKYDDGGEVNNNDFSMSAPEGWVGSGSFNKGRDYSPAWGGQFAMGGSLPGAVGFMYARTNNPAPSNGPYAKKTKASAENGKNIKPKKESTFSEETLLDRQKAYKTIRPSSYGDPLNYIRYATDHQRTEYDDARSEEAFSTYLGLNKGNKFLSPSKYRPTITTGNPQNLQYYQVDPKLEQDIFNSFKDKVKLNQILPVNENDVTSIYPSDTKGLFTENGKEYVALVDRDYGNLFADPMASRARMLGNFNVSRGKDKKGEYISYSDQYDFPEIFQNKMKGQPYNIYGRIYYPKKEDGGAVMKYYQEGLDWKPKTISKDGSQLVKLDQLTNFTNYNTKQPGGWLDKYEG